MRLAQPTAHLAAVQSRHPDIQDEEIWPLLACQAKRVEAVIRNLNAEAATLEQWRERRGYSLIIIRQENTRHAFTDDQLPQAAHRAS